MDKAIGDVETKVSLDNGIVGINAGTVTTGYAESGIIKIDIPTQGFSGAFDIEVQGVFLEGTYESFDLRIGLNSAVNNTISSVSALLIEKTKRISKVAAGYDSVNKNLCIFVYSATNRFQYLRVNIGRVIIRASTGSTPRLSNWKMDYVADTSGITNVAETPVNWVATDDGVWYD